MTDSITPSSTVARRQRLMRLGGLLVLAVVVVTAAIVLSGRAGSDGATPAGSSAGATSVTPTAKTPSLAGIPQEGNILGNPKAPVRVVEFADLQCPFCRDFALGTLPSVIDGPVRAGEVRLEFRTLAFLGPDSVSAARIVEAAGRQDRLWQVVEQLYARQGPENSGWLTNEVQRQVLASVPGLDAGRVEAERDSAAVTARLRAAERLARRHGVDSTPTFLVGRADGLRAVTNDRLPSAIAAAIEGR